MYIRTNIYPIVKYPSFFESSGIKNIIAGHKDNGKVTPLSSIASLAR